MTASKLPLDPASRSVAVSGLDGQLANSFATGQCGQRSRAISQGVTRRLKRWQHACSDQAVQFAHNSAEHLGGGADQHAHVEADDLNLVLVD